MKVKKYHVPNTTSKLLESFKYISKIFLKNINKVLVGLSYFLYPFLFLILKMSELNKSLQNRSDGHKNSTITVRNSISPNWQAFLQTQTQPKKNSDDKTRIKKEINSYYKIMRTEKQNLKKNNFENKVSSNENIISKVKNKDGSPVLTKYIAMDCEMVGIGERGLDNMLARISLVNKFGDCIYDKFVKPRELVVDYRTPVSGVRKEDLINAESFDIVQKEVADIINGRILVGHAIRNDLDVLFLSHPSFKIRDTSRYKPFRAISKGGTPSLKRLSEEFLSVNIQKGEHSSVEDARATMQLYCLHAKHWEDMLKRKNHKKTISSSSSQITK